MRGGGGGGGGSWWIVWAIKVSILLHQGVVDVNVTFVTGSTVLGGGGVVGVGDGL